MLDASLTGKLPEELGRLSTALRRNRSTATRCPNRSRSAGSDAGRELVEIVPAEDVSDNAAARGSSTPCRASWRKATGLPVVYQEASDTVVRAFALALGLRIPHGDRDHLARACATRRDFAARDRADSALASASRPESPCSIGMPLNYANIIALPLLVGIGVDNGIHVVHRMRTEPPERSSFNTSTMRAVLASGLTTVASFGNLAFSSHVGTASMGMLLALGLAVSMAATLIVLPAWLKVFGHRARSAAHA